MAFNSASQQSVRPGNRTSIGHNPSPNASLLLEKTKANMRRSTPDSEALASSDDEQDQHPRVAQISCQPLSKTARRTSLLNENPATLHRKGSTSGSDGFLSSASHGPSPSTDSSAWPPSVAGLGRNSMTNQSFPWGNNIWADHQKGPPARLTEVLPSPAGQGSAVLSEDPLASPSARRDSATEAAIPFAIPLHPTLKTYRSQSYSVGQLDQEVVNSSSRHSQLGHTSRIRTGSSYSSLQHRPSRPSMLGDFSPETSILGQLREVDDDDEISTVSSEAGARLPMNNAKTIEQLAMENAILRQQAYSSHFQTGNSSNNASTGLFPPTASFASRSASRSIHADDSVVEEPDDLANAHTIAPRTPSFARASVSSLTENQALENVKKGHWQSSLGFGGITEIPQSRRHSFADVSLRNASPAAGGNGTIVGSEEPQNRGYGDLWSQQGYSDNSSYFSNPLARSSDNHRPPSSSSTRPPSNGSYQAHVSHNIRPAPQLSQQLYLVTFKAARAEFYYTQEGTGLDVNAGDLVIVEADRGTDLGTVAHKNVDWASAKQLKERYVVEHYNWLMMFSRQGQPGQSNSINSLAALSASGRSLSSSIGGVSPAGHGSISEVGNIEIKPKMIKRLAQPHEVHMLREKEGNEAKAKRMCQQKVAEHHLNMEILDAEFQMDWKKLTFYYYAEAYVNFNSLVTDLFKIYKTRIWMSAINPASFVSPTALQSAGVATGILQQSHERYLDSRSKADEHIASAPQHHEGATENIDLLWQDGRGSSILPSMSHTAFGPYFPTQSQNFSATGFPPVELNRSLYPHYRPTSPVTLPSYVSAGSLQRAGHLDPRYTESADKSQYSEQLSAFHGLSLGS